MDIQAEAFEKRVHQYKERVYMLAFQMTRNHADADELSQEAFLRAYESFGRFRGDSDFFTWIYRITVNLCLTHLKKQSRWRRFPEAGAEEETLIPEPSIQENPTQGMEEEETRRRVWKALQVLSPELRAATVLVYLQDFSPREAARSLGCAEATVHWRLFKARKLLKKYL